jgi:acyl-CoA synthetase (AMP-forming)/AMP-acid ligase II
MPALDLDSLFPDPARARERRRLLARWRSRGLHDETTLPAAIARAAREDPDNAVVMHSAERPGTIRLDALERESAAIARALLRRGFAPGDVVAVQLPNWVETILLYAALSRIGAVFVPIVHIYGPSETDWILRASGARAFFCPTRWGSIDFRARLARMPACEKLDVVMIGDGVARGASAWSDLAASGAGGGDLPAVRAGDPLLIVYTSGTTSDPKGVVHTHQTLLAELRNMPHLPMGSRGVVSLQPWPAGHIGGLCALLAPIVTETRCILVDRWDAEAAAGLIAQHGVSTLCGTPFHVAAMVERKEAGDARLGSLREVVCGGAGVPPELIERCERLGWLARRAYGSTEHPTASAGSVRASAAVRARTDGAACPGTEIRIARDDGSEAAPGEAGEVWLRGPEQFLGYTDPELNRCAFAPGGWLRTGDVGALDADGNLTITDRLKDLIIRGGENLSSLEIESLVLRHEGVAEAAAIGLPDERYGERVCVFVVPTPGSAAPGVPELLAHFERLGVAKQKTPERVVTVDALPRTPAGKVKKDELRRRLAERGGGG